ncbi:hypothetical protein VUR80DRAFT_6049 [Thermomyces stellatus]
MIHPEVPGSLTQANLRRPTGYLITPVPAVCPVRACSPTAPDKSLHHPLQSGPYFSGKKLRLIRQLTPVPNRCRLLRSRNRRLKSATAWEMPNTLPNGTLASFSIWAASKGVPRRWRIDYSSFLSAVVLISSAIRPAASHTCRTTGSERGRPC